MTDDFYLPPQTTAPAPIVLTDEEKQTRSNRVFSLAAILFISLIIYTGDFPLGLYLMVRDRPVELAIVVGILAWYDSGWTRKHTYWFKNW